jgi:hypothetical protein
LSFNRTGIRVDVSVITPISARPEAEKELKSRFAGAGVSHIDIDGPLTN